MIFPVLEVEELVQEKDKTRLNALKSYVSGDTAITSIEITPDKLATPVDATADGFLDWQYDFGIQIHDGNKYLDFSEGAGELTATLTIATQYTLAELATQIQTQMRAAGALLYVVSVSADDKLTISAPSAFSLLTASGTNASASIFPEIYFDAADLVGALSYTGDSIDEVIREVTVVVENATDDETITREIRVISERADRLFSTDDKLRRHESDVLKYVPEGRATFKDVHRRAQELMLAWLDTEGYTDYLGDPLVKERFLDTKEVTEWATHEALRLIYENLSNAIDDVYSVKAKRYEKLVPFYRGRAILRIDMNQDGQTEPHSTEGTQTRFCTVVRR
jgi:hypothetical protein